MCSQKSFCRRDLSKVCQSPKSKQYCSTLAREAHSVKWSVPEKSHFPPRDHSPNPSLPSERFAVPAVHIYQCSLSVPVSLVRHRRGLPRGCCSHRPWRGWRNVQLWCWGTCGETLLVGDGWTDDLGGLFHRWWLYGSMILTPLILYSILSLSGFLFIYYNQVPKIYALSATILLSTDLQDPRVRQVTGRKRGWPVGCLVPPELGDIPAIQIEQPLFEVSLLRFFSRAEYCFNYKVNALSSVDYSI